MLAWKQPYVCISDDRPGLIESMSETEQYSQGRFTHDRLDELNVCPSLSNHLGLRPDSPRP